MLRIQNLQKGFAGELIFDDVSIQLNPGDKYSLVGRNGCGKSTLLKIIIGNESADAGEVHKPKNYRLGYLEQHIQFTHNTVLEEAKTALLPEDKDNVYKVEEILSGLGFKEEEFDKDPNSFSGGYQLRIQLTKTLVKDPDCLLLDEPTNYLDIVAIRWLTRFLKRWKGELIVISHDRSFLDAISTHTMGIHRKQLFRLKGQTKAYYDAIVLQEETHEKARQKIDKKVNRAESYIKKYGAKATKAKQAQSKQKMIDKLPSLEKLANLEGLNFQFKEAPFPGRTMQNCEKISFQYPNKASTLIEGLSLEISPGDRIAIVGKNGRGKSTFLKLLGNDLKPTDGTIKRSENLRVGYFGQTNIGRLNPELSVEKEIALSNRELSYSEIRGICGVMLFPQKNAEKKIGVLSGGEKSRVLLGKILATPCNLLLLDEPSNHLDIESIEALVEALESFSGSVIIVSHNEEILHRIPDKFITFKEDEQHTFLGDYQTYLEKIGWDDTPTKKTAKPKSSKEDKRKRAELIQERSKTLAPVRKKIQSLEKNIQREEKAHSGYQEALYKAGENQSNDEVAELSRKVGESNKQLDTMYSSLDLLYTELEKIESRYTAS